MAPADDKPRLFLLGDARQVHLLRWAEYFDEAGYEVLTLTLEEPTAKYPGRVHVLHVSTALPDAVRYPLAVPAARAMARRFAPHVVNAHFVPNYGLIASKLGRDPWVLSTWGSDVMTDPDKSAFHMWRTRRVLASARYVTSDADVMTERLQRLGVPLDHILTFPYGVDTDLFFPPTGPVAGGPRIVSNRKLEPVYGVSTVIDAFPGVHEAFPGAELTIAGDGSLHTELIHRAEGSLGARSITFVGAVDHARMPGLLRENDIYVSASRSDTTSVSLLEAMACGLLPVVTDIPANREWITHGENGVLVPVGQPMALALAIIEAWRDRALVERARRVNVERVRQRARWRDNMRSVHALFDSIAGRP